MNKTFLMVVHQKTSITGRIGQKLEQRGYVLDQRCPMENHALPECMDDYHGAVIFGGPMSANDDHLPGIRAELDWLPGMLASNKPLLGICLGAQLLARVLGARVTTHPEGFAEIGYYPIKPANENCSLFTEQLNVYHWHREGFALPECAHLLAQGDCFANQAFRYADRTYGVQFHPEVTRDMMERWMKNGVERLKLPGAQQPEQQLDGYHRYDTTLGAWLDRFLDYWLDDKVELAHI
jgi:GMP synthase (glutamine-hydrolysing)